MSLCFEQERCQGTELPLTVKWQGWSWQGRLEKERDWGNREQSGLKLNHPQACLQPSAGMSSGEATPGTLLGRDCFQAFGAGNAAREYFIAVGLRWRLRPALSDAEGLLWRHRNRGRNSFFYSPKRKKRSSWRAKSLFSVIFFMTGVIQNENRNYQWFQRWLWVQGGDASCSKL